MQFLVGWLARIADKGRAWFARQAAPVPMTAASPSVITELVGEASVAPQSQPRMLAARIACQAKLNVPVGKTPRIARIMPAKTATRRPKQSVGKNACVKKAATSARSVYLPARHLAEKARPKQRSNVIAMPTIAKTAKPHGKITVSKLQRLAA